VVISIVVPVWNEQARIERVLAGLEALPFATQIVVVDDGSTDATAPIVDAWALTRPNVELVRLPHRGKGAAIRAAIPRLRGDLTVFQDGDGEYDPADIPALIAPLESGRADVVFGTRLHSDNEFVRFHRLGNRILSGLTRLLADLPVTDMETGYKAFRTSVLRQLELHADDFSIEPELAVRVGKAHLRLAEVAISYRGRSRAEGKNIGWRDGIRAIRTLFFARFGGAQTAKRGDRWTAPLAPTTTRAFAALIGLLTFALYLVGSTRSYDYDSSETVGSFIATRSLLDPFRRQLVYNNHPLFSFLDHLVYSAGAHSAVALRALPIMFGASSVAILVATAGRRWGAIAAITSGIVLAANPTFAELSRSVRGYSLLCLCAIASTLLLESLLKRPRRSFALGYVFLVAAGLATHLYMLLVLIAHIALVLARPARPLRWIGRWLTALALGSIAYLHTGAAMLHSAGRAGHLLRLRFPLALLTALLGSSRATLVILGLLALTGATLVFSRAVALASAALAACVVVVWLVLAPLDLYPRFFIWLAIPLALAVALAAQRLPPLTLPLIVAAIVLMVHIDLAHWTQNPLPDQQAARVIQAARGQGQTPCVFPLIRGSLLAYTNAPREITDPNQLQRCQLVLSIAGDPLTLRLAARHAFPHHWELKAWTPMTVYSQLSKEQLQLTSRPA
jgi:glycosyltransferase involved in cell wall biosynthesis